MKISRPFNSLAILAAFSVFSLGQAKVLIERGSEWKYFKGTEQPASAEHSWWDAGFDDSAWVRGLAPFRYGDGQGGTFFRDMQRRYSTVFLRRTFEAKDFAAFSVLDLNVNFDDGFKIWINSKLVLSINAPDNPRFFSVATETHESGQFEPFKISDIGSFLKKGANTIAIQAFNLSLTSSDFLIDAELVGIPKDFDEPKLVSVSPKPGKVSALQTVTVRFSEPVHGVDYDDMLLNGRSADNVQGKNDTWVFTFLDVGYGEAKVTWASGHEIEDFARPANVFDAVSAGELGSYQIVDDIAPELIEVMPPPGATVRELKRLRFFFSKPIAGFDVEDIRVNGQTPIAVSGFADGPWEVRLDEIKSGKVNVTWANDHGIADCAPKPNVFDAGNWSYTVDANHSPGNVVINEFLASNQTGLADEDGQAADWIELRNTGKSSVDLAGWSLTDEKSRPGKWTFPAVSIGSGDYLLVFASGKNRRDSSGKLHTNFKLGSGGNYLGLFSPELPRQAVDKISPKYPEQRNDISYGLSATDQWVYFTKPTPSERNGVGSFKDVLAKPKFNKKRGFFVNPFSLEITAKDSDTVIRYTTDFSEPTATSGQVYRGPIPISKTTVIRAAAFARDAWPSQVATRTYVLGDSEAITSLPLLSLVTEQKNLWGESGILEVYPRNTTKRGIEWERSTSSELFFPDKKGGFQIDTGLRLQGGDFIRGRHLPNKPVPWSKYSFRLYFRGLYGESRLNYQMFPDLPLDEFEHVVLRAGMNDSINPFICDELCRRLYRDLGHASSRGVLVNLLLNGESQAYYNPVERIDINFLRSRHGGGTEWDLVAQFGEIREGDVNEWNRFKRLMISRDMSVPSNYAKAVEMMEIGNFIDYIMLCIYVDMDDWPYNNWRASRERKARAKWRFYIWDAERSFGTDGKQMLGRQRRVVTSNNLTQGALTSGADIARLFRSLMVSPEFRLRFADRVQMRYFNNGVLTDEHVALRHRELTDKMKHVLPDMSPYIGDVWIPRRRDIVMRQMASVGIQLSQNAPRFSQHGGSVPAGYRLGITAPAGKIYFTADGTDPREPSANIYESPIAVERHVTVKARSLASGEWSAMTEATFTPEQLGFPVRITEVMYNPLGGSEYEFIELYNFSEIEVDLSWCRLNGIDFTFGLQAKLGPRERIVLASDQKPEAFARRYPGLKVSGWFSGSLANGGEKLILEDANSKILTSLEYDDKGAWPSEADGNGSSLELDNPLSTASVPTNWKPSVRPGGTPGD